MVEPCKLTQYPSWESCERGNSGGLNLHTLSTLLQWRPFMLLFYRWIHLAYTDLLFGLKVHPKVSNPLKLSLFCTSPKENKIREWCAVFFLFFFLKHWPVHPPPLSPSLQSSLGMETVLIVGSEQVQSGNREPEKVHKLHGRPNQTALLLC